MSLLILSFATGGCASLSGMGETASYEAESGLLTPAGTPLFQQMQAPLSWRPEVAPKGKARKLVPVKAEVCQRGINLPTQILSKALGSSPYSIGFDDGSYAKVISELMSSNPGIQNLYDVKIDVAYLSVLAVYIQACTQLSALAAITP